MAGFQSILGSDIHPIYSATFAKNHPNTHIITDDIRSLSEYEILKLTKLKPGELDLIAGGLLAKDSQLTLLYELLMTKEIIFLKNIFVLQRY